MDNIWKGEKVVGGENSSPLPSPNYGERQDKLIPGLHYPEPPASETFNACLIQVGTQSIPTSTQTILTGMTNTSGNAGMIATANRITITQAGTYLISISIFDATGASSGVRNATIVKNGANAFIARRIASSTSSLDISASYPLVLVVGDYIELAAYQDSGISMAASTSFISAIKIA